MTTRTALTVLAWLALAYLAVRLADVLLGATVALLLAAALAPAVAFFQPRLGRPLAVVLTYALVLAVVALVGLVVVPTLVHQLEALVANLPVYVAKLHGHSSWLRELDQRFNLLPDLEVLTRQLATRASAWLGAGLGWAGKAAGAVASAAAVLIASFYVLVDAPRLKQGFLGLWPPELRGRVEAMFDPVSAVLGRYFLGLLVTIGFLCCFLATALSVAGVPMALALTLLAGLLDVIPMVGSLIAAVPAVLIALTVSWQLALVTAGIYMVGNFLEGNVIAPQVNARSVNLAPALVLFALAVGIKLFGLVGAVIAVPILAAIHVVLQEWGKTAPEGAPKHPRLWSIMLPDEAHRETRR
jgi:predicted PurR-regulated permease PerM